MKALDGNVRATAPPQRKNDMTSNELAACPCCETDATLIPKALPKSIRFYVKCDNEACGLQTNVFATEAEAIAAWNTRTTTPAPDSVVEAVGQLKDQLGWRVNEFPDGDIFEAYLPAKAWRTLLAVLASEPCEAMQVLLPPAADVGSRYLEGWCEGQAYLIENYGKEGEGDAAIETVNTYLKAHPRTPDGEAVETERILRELVAELCDSDDEGLVTYVPQVEAAIAHIAKLAERDANEPQS